MQSASNELHPRRCYLANPARSLIRMPSHTRVSDNQALRGMLSLSVGVTTSGGPV